MPEDGQCATFYKTANQLNSVSQQIQSVSQAVIHSTSAKALGEVHALSSLAQ